MPFALDVDYGNLGRDNGGRLHVIWKNGGSLFYGRIENRQIVGREEIPNSGDVKTRFTRPRLAVRPDGTTVHTSWTPGNGYAVVHVWRDSQGWHRRLAWEQPDAATHAAVPAIGVDLAGVVHIVAQQWYDPPNDDQGPVIYLRKPPDAGWAAPAVVQQPQGRQWRDTSMFVDSSGGIHATWKDGGGVGGKYRHVASGGDLSQAATIDIPRMPDTSILSFGDTWVTDEGDVHHAFCSFKNMYDSWIDYAVKRSGDAGFSGHSRISDLLPHCEAAGYDDPWPAIVVSSSGRIFVSWAICEAADFPRVNQVYLAVREGDAWSLRLLDGDADIDTTSKPAMTAIGDTVFVLWRGGDGQLMLAEITPDSPDAGVEDGGDGGTDDGGEGEGVAEEGETDTAADRGETRAEGDPPADPDGEPDGGQQSDADGELASGGCGCSAGKTAAGGKVALLVSMLLLAVACRMVRRGRPG